ncbi:RAMP superfamily CRISPR-associated protein [Micromonospora sp. RTGN7]|uniref:RAMP superfamily CRISPR-associated protein n=1 Tax=Micromonospora sp. RTGN7 TaxID=3016526 RepID=UPI0029FF1175|nr:RAMP superfamily CRISPR-associated protein [Micromonospora sp. RTGN7]
MGQSIGTRIEVLGTLVCLGPVHVGGWDSTSAEANLTVARDGTGRPFLPGTSLAGALRAYIASLEQFRRAEEGNELIDALFGHIGGRHSQEGSPSWIRVDDAHLIGPDVAPVTRDGVGIDRVSASAAASILYTRQVLPAGTRFALRLVADTPTAAADPVSSEGWPALIEQAMRGMVAGLRRGRVTVGAGRGRGFGRVELRDVTVRRVDLSDPAGLVAWLTGAVPVVPDEDPAPVGPDEHGEASVQSDGRLVVTVDWRPIGPLLVRDSVSGTVVDTLPLTETAADGTVRLLLPGSSIRGVIRSHAERIVRTLQGRDEAPAEEEDDKDLLAVLRQPPLGVDMLFGSAPAGRGEDGDRKGWRGVLHFSDCHSVGRISAQTWNEIVTISPNPTPVAQPESGLQKPERDERNTERERTRNLLRETLNGSKKRGLAFTVSDHVAIDRWTGGASDHRLFSVLDPDAKTAWEPIRLEVDVARLTRHGRSDGASAALPLLLLVLRDLRDGWLSLGYGGTRGRGQIEVTDVTFDGAGLDGSWQSLAGRTLDTILADPPEDVIAAMSTWKALFEETAA